MYTYKSVVEITVQVKAFTLDITQDNNVLYDDHVVFWVIMCRDKKCLNFRR